MKRLLALALTLATATPWAQQPSWFKFDDRVEASSFTDLDRIKRDIYGVQTFRAWWLTNYKSAKAFKGMKYDDTVALYRVDCLSGGLGLLQITARNIKGATVWSSGAQPETIALPDSVGEGFVQLICSHAKANGL